MEALIGQMSIYLGTLYSDGHQVSKMPNLGMPCTNLGSIHKKLSWYPTTSGSPRSTTTVMSYRHAKMALSAAS